ncbi:MAG: YggS family pyridoxal phosphate-dependent enzyme [Candidatus Magnetoovum sp. WYHC-5]|nr:YggS family pyridoxal phosphate-dependent enzyme [Candidatus Magnetoovum sp. WYHC-5]
MPKAENSLSNTIGNIYRKLSHAAMRAGRQPDEVTLLAVTKKVNTQIIDEAINCGLRDLGENYVQEASNKISTLTQLCPFTNTRWHLIGHLQKNKVRSAVKLFSVIHTVDSYELALLIDKEAKKIQKVQKALIQVKLSKEDTKHGIDESELLNLIKDTAGFENLQFEGLMTIPEYLPESQLMRPVYGKLRFLRDTLHELGYQHFKELSMGMSDDFEIAIEEGATIVRVGSAIFGQRIN